MSDNSMVLDLDNFDFGLIDSEQETATDPKSMVMDTNDFRFDDEDVKLEDLNDDEVYEDEEDEGGDDDGDDDDVATSLATALSNLNAVPDDFELDFGDTKVAKGELVSLLNTREELNKSRDAVVGFTTNLVQKEQAIKVAFEVAKTETERQLEHVYSVLNDPNKWNSGMDIQSLQKARIQLEARQKELDVKAQEAQASVNEQRQQAAVFNIQKTIRELGSQEPLTQAARFAEAKGLNLDHLVEGLTPEMVRMLNNAEKYEQLLSKNKARLDEVKRNKKPRSTKTGAHTAKNAASRKAQMLAAYDAGKIDATKMFEFLED